MLLVGAGVVVAAVARPAAAAGWSIQPVPTPAHSHETDLNAVSCASTRDCVAVGFQVSRSRYRTTRSRWSSTGTARRGRPSRPRRPARRAGRGALSAVSCPFDSACVAVGLSYSVESGPRSARRAVGRVILVGRAHSPPFGMRTPSTACRARQAPIAWPSVTAGQSVRAPLERRSLARSGRLISATRRTAKRANRCVLPTRHLRRGRVGQRRSMRRRIAASTRSRSSDPGRNSCGRCGGIPTSPARTTPATHGAGYVTERGVVHVADGVHRGRHRRLPMGRTPLVDPTSTDRLRTRSIGVSCHVDERLHGGRLPGSTRGTVTAGRQPARSRGRRASAAALGSVSCPSRSPGVAVGSYDRPPADHLLVESIGGEER